MAKRVAFYVRVSTSGQTVENQVAELNQVAERAGWTVVTVYRDEGISGAKGRDRRPAFDRMLKAAVRREFDMVAAWSVDRLGRSLIDLVSFLQELRAASVGIYLHQQGLDTSTPSGEAMFGMLGVFAQFERSIITERVRAGVARARAQGKHLGRPRTDAKLERAIAATLATGAGVNKTAAAHGVGNGTVMRIKRAMTQPEA